MATVFVPYKNKTPATVTINGHRLLIISNERSPIEGSLEGLGADRVRKMRVAHEEDISLARLAKRAKAGLVVAAGELNFDEIIKNLEAELPWIQ